VSDVRKKREAVGVQLYGYQQQLAQLQLSLENTHEKFSSASAARTEAQRRLGADTEAYATVVKRRDTLVRSGWFCSRLLVVFLFCIVVVFVVCLGVVFM
jgi:cytochrome c-type biogenesis protein CcmH/NrfG